MRAHVRPVDRQSFLVWVAILTCIPAGLQAIQPGHNWGGDFAAYIQQSESLVKHQLSEYIAANREIITQSDERVGPVLYPWGYPLSLAPAEVLFGRDLTVMKLENVLYYALFLIALSALLRRRLSRPELAGLLILLAVCPACLGFVDQVVSDTLFLALSTIALAAIDRWAVPSSPSTANWKPVLVGVIIGYACITRVNGLLLLGALALYQWSPMRDMLRHSGERPSGSLLYMGLPYLTSVWLIILIAILLPRSQASYIHQLANIDVRSVGRNLLRYPIAFRHLFTPIPAGSVLYALTIPPLVVGVVRAWTKDRWLVGYALGTVAVYILWPYYQGLRFLIPLVPLYGYFVIIGTQSLASSMGTGRGRSRLGDAVLIGMVYVVTAAYLAHWVRSSYQANISTLTDAGPYSLASEQAFRAVQVMVPPTAHVAFFKPRVLYLRSGRVGLGVFKPTSLQRVQYYLWYKGARELQIPDQAIDSLVGRGSLLLEYKNSAFVLYRVALPASKQIR